MKLLMLLKGAVVHYVAVVNNENVMLCRRCFTCGGKIDCKRFHHKDFQTSSGRLVSLNTFRNPFTPTDECNLNQNHECPL